MAHHGKSSGLIMHCCSKEYVFFLPASYVSLRMRAGVSERLDVVSFGACANDNDHVDAEAPTAGDSSPFLVVIHRVPVIIRLPANRFRAAAAAAVAAAAAAAAA